MKSRALRRTGRALLAGAVLFGCASESLVQNRGQAPTTDLAVSKVAVVPFSAVQRPGAEPLRPDAGALVAGYAADAFSARGIDTVPPSDVEQALGEAAGSTAAVREAAQHFGAAAVVVGSVYKFRERSGEALGSVHPASVGFELKVYTADGRLFDSKVFDHTQVALTENALTATQYPGGGTRWLTAEELARWAADQTVKSLRIVQR